MTPIEQTEDGTIIATGDGVYYYDICATIAVIKLHISGIRFGRRLTTAFLSRKWNIDPPAKNFKAILAILEERRDRYIQSNSKNIRIVTHGEDSPQ